MTNVRLRLGGVGRWAALLALAASTGFCAAACSDARRRAPLPSAPTSTTGAATPGVASPGQSSAPVAAGLTRHPIVLIHGMAGFASLGGIGYFNRVPERLRALGCEVLVTRSSPIHTTAHRATQVRDQLLAAYPDPAVKLNLVGHSQGGLDARYLISTLGLGDRVASLTTIGTPHRGSSMADVAVGLIPGQAQQAIDLFLNGLGMDWNQMSDLTTVHMRTVFNPQNPDDPRVWYQSFAGRADPFGRATGVRLNPLFFATFPVLAGFEGENDGVVSLASARWGLDRGTIACDHGGEIGWPYIPAAPAFDHLAFYEELARDLARRGF